MEVVADQAGWAGPFDSCAGAAPVPAPVLAVMGEHEEIVAQLSSEHASAMERLVYEHAVERAAEAERLSRQHELEKALAADDLAASHAVTMERLEQEHRERIWQVRIKPEPGTL